MIALIAFLVCLAFLCIAAVFIAALIGRVFMAFGRHTERQRLIESAQYEANRAAEWEARARVAEARLGERDESETSEVLPFDSEAFVDRMRSSGWGFKEVTAESPARGMDDEWPDEIGG